jgi:site-specific DNA recombinase
MNCSCIGLGSLSGRPSCRPRSAPPGSRRARGHGRWKLARGILAELSAFESDRVGDTWREVRERRVAHGLPGNGHVMFGYRKRKDGQYVPDRRTGPLLAEMYRRYNRGTSFADLARWLNSHRIPTAQRDAAKGCWTRSGVAALMDRPFAAGFVKFGGELVPGAQEPLIDISVWEAYRTRRANARYSRPVLPFDDFLVLGLARCACGAGQLSPTHAGNGRAPATGVSHTRQGAPGGPSCASASTASCAAG